LEISALGLGAAALGRVSDQEPDLDEKGARVLEAAYQAGLYHVDTSPAYNRSEHRLGIAIKRNRFEDLTVSTKAGTHPARKGCYGRDDIRWSIRNSLRVMGLERIDIALIHDPPSMEPVLKTGDGFDALAELREEGMCGNIGIGVRDHRFHYAAIESSKVDVILTYGDYNIVRRTALPLMKAASDKGIGVLLGSPHMYGLLADPAGPEKRRWRDEDDVRIALEWWEWCREREVSMRHLNMRFVLECPYISRVLTGAANEREVSENVHDATTSVAEDVWKEALDRIAMLDERRHNPPD